MRWFKKKLMIDVSVIERKGGSTRTRTIVAKRSHDTNIYTIALNNYQGVRVKVS